MTRTLRNVFAAVLLSGAGAMAISACASSTHHTGSITPAGTVRGTYHYCSYTPTGSGISISQYEYTPCVVKDTRTKKARKAQPTRTSYVGVPQAGRTLTTTLTPSSRTTVTVTVQPSAAKTSKLSVPKANKSVKTTKTSHKH